MNRLRELKSNSFRKYTSLKKLYLNDNMIMSIHSSTFEKLTSLQSLDLSMNVLFEVPTQLFHMSSLEELFLGQNPRLDIFGLINNSVPISAPIKYLDISYSPMLTHLPEFGTFMDLVHLNVSGNSLKDLTMSSFIGLCNLRYFTGENLTVEFVNPCSCKQVDAWFNQTNVRTFPPFFHRCLYVNHGKSCNNPHCHNLISFFFQNATKIFSQTMMQALNMKCANWNSKQEKRFEISQKSAT